MKSTIRIAICESKADQQMIVFKAVKVDEKHPWNSQLLKLVFSQR